jgi:hypothetical protein
MIPRSFSSVDWVMIIHSHLIFSIIGRTEMYMFAFVKYSPPTPRVRKQYMVSYAKKGSHPNWKCSKLVKNIQHLSYSDRSRYLGLPSLQYRRLRSDMVEMFRIINNIDKVNSNKIFPKNENTTNWFRILGVDGLYFYKVW